MWPCRTFFFLRISSRRRFDLMPLARAPSGARHLRRRAAPIRGQGVLHFAAKQSLTAFVRAKGVTSYASRMSTFASTSAPSICPISHAVSSYAFTFWSTCPTIGRRWPSSGASCVPPARRSSWCRSRNGSTRPARTCRSCPKRTGSFISVRKITFAIIRGRLREAEFSIRECVSREPYVLKHGLRRGERVLLCTRVE